MKQNFAREIHDNLYSLGKKMKGGRMKLNKKV
jgi:hypothetical protein